MNSPLDTGTGAISAAAILAFSFGGVTTASFMLGTGCFVVGSISRCGLKIASAVERGEPPKVGAALAALSVAPMLAAFASMSTFFAAHIIGFEGDAAIGLLLALTGFRGAEGIQGLVLLVSKAIPEKLGGGKAQEPKP